MAEIVSISSITIDRAQRQRRELTGIDELAASIQLHGLIQPIVVDENNVLIAGERRLTACTQLGWTAIEVMRFSDLTRAGQYAIELEENIRRNELPWMDRCAAIYNYHQLQLAEDPEWNNTRTAEQLGLTSSTVTQTLRLQEEISAGNPLVVNAESFTTARGIVARLDERRKASDAESISAIIGAPTPTPDSSDPLLELLGQPVQKNVHIPLMLGDFTEWVATYTGPRFNFIHCDFPYGIDAGEHPQGAAGSFGGYADSKDIYFSLLKTFLDNQEVFVADSAHLMFWFSMNYYSETLQLLRQAGWRVQHVPLIWFKSDNTGIIPDPQRGPRQVYETAFLASRGDRKIVQSVANVFAAPATKTIHMSEKSLAMLSHFFRMTVDKSTIMLDPTCGSANAVKAAQRANARTVLGIERDPEFYTKATENWLED